MVSVCFRQEAGRRRGNVKAILIHPYDRTVEYVDVKSGRDLNEWIKGSISLAYMWENGDTLYADDDGIGEGFDALAGRGEVFRSCQFDLGLHQTFFGIGIIVGDENDVGEITDVRTPIDDIRSRISFIWPHALAASGNRN
jgi:hypothetical protein